MSDLESMKPFKCKHGHILGYMRTNGNGIPQLLVLRHAIDTEAEKPAEVDVMLGPVTGSMQVRCDLCDDHKPWVVSVEALLYLVESMPAELLFQFWRRLLERAKK